MILWFCKSPPLLSTNLPAQSGGFMGFVASLTLHKQHHPLLPACPSGGLYTLPPPLPPPEVLHPRGCATPGFCLGPSGAGAQLLRPLPAYHHPAPSWGAVAGGHLPRGASPQPAGCTAEACAGWHYETGSRPEGQQSNSEGSVWGVQDLVSFWSLQDLPAGADWDFGLAFWQKCWQFSTAPHIRAYASVSLKTDGMVINEFHPKIHPQAAEPSPQLFLSTAPSHMPFHYLRGTMYKSDILGPSHRLLALPAKSLLWSEELGNTDCRIL